jgi:hypothetical protein
MKPINQSMKNITRTLLSLFALGSLPCSAAVTLLSGYTGTSEEISNASATFYSANVSSSDLINGKIPAITGFNGAANPSAQASANKMTDGINGTADQDAGQIPGGWTTVNATATYTLGTGANNLGYDITSVQTIAAWPNAGFGNQNWTVSVRLVGAPLFTDLATLNYQPFGGSEGGSSLVLLNNLNVTGVDAIRFTAGSVNLGVNEGAFIARELDVFGASTVPEPSAALLGGLGMLALLRRRR